MVLCRNMENYPPIIPLSIWSIEIDGTCNGNCMLENIWTNMLKLQYGPDRIIPNEKTDQGSICFQFGQ